VPATVRVATDLPAGADRVWAAMPRPAGAGQPVTPRVT
jgi:hypothetical protein